MLAEILIMVNSVANVENRHLHQSGHVSVGLSIQVSSVVNVENQDLKNKPWYFSQG